MPTKHPCTYCPEPGADTCVRTHRDEQGRQRHIYAHRACAEARGVKPMYVYTETPAGPGEV